ncbi:MAG: cell cycle transcriptional regulator TrcR [Alphaproteobacteria bacterium]|tara:strand:+ start:2374 stop:3054 length:681 start_codon:yes stop_codon:yes gene_type:complete
MARPLMPKATAVWLVENTALTFRQIAEFCGLHELEVQAIADDEVAIGMQGLDPVQAGELTQEELERCEGDATASLKAAKPSLPLPKKTKGARYTPVAKRQDRPDAIAWLVKNYPEMSDGQISKLIGTTKPTIMSVRDRSHWNTSNIKPQNPVGLGLCTADDLEKVIAVARARAGTVHGPAAQASGVQGMEPAAPPAPAEPAPAPEPSAESVWPTTENAPATEGAQD